MMRFMERSDRGDQLVIAYYHWAQADFEREIREGFPFLRRIKEQHLVFRVLPLLESLPAEKLYPLARVLVKRFHLTALELLGEEMTREDTKLIEWYLATISRWSADEIRLQEDMQDNPERFRLDRNRFAALLKEHLIPILGNNLSDKTRRYWRYETQVKDVAVSTYVDIGGHYHQLVYGHQLPIWSHAEYRIPHTHILHWLGLYGQTQWDILNNKDIEETAKMVGLLCSHFLEGLSGIVGEVTG